MLRIKKLDIFVLKSFLLLFSGTFFICLFIFMMQFLWRYVDELVGKGLEINVLAQFFFLSALTLIPLSLPLAILLAALMTFGNFGSRNSFVSHYSSGCIVLHVFRCHVILLSECHRPQSTERTLDTTGIHEAKITGSGYSGRGVLQ